MSSAMTGRVLLNRLSPDDSGRRPLTVCVLGDLRLLFWSLQSRTFSSECFSVCLFKKKHQTQRNKKQKNTETHDEGRKQVSEENPQVIHCNWTLTDGQVQLLVHFHGFGHILTTCRCSRCSRCRRCSTPFQCICELVTTSYYSIFCFKLVKYSFDTVVLVLLLKSDLPPQ